MRISFRIQAPPFSINGAYYRNRGKTEKCRYWQDGVIFELRRNDIKEKLTNFKSAFDEKKHCISASYHFLLPKSKLITAKNQISKKSADLTNVEKLLQDIIFEPRYSSRVFNLGINDGLVTRVESSKKVSPDSNFWIDITLEILEIDPWAYSIFRKN